MPYINTNTMQYPVSESEIRAAFPNTSFPTPFVPPAGYEWVFPTPQPEFDHDTHVVIEAAPALNALGQWAQQWQVVALSPEQIASKEAELAAQRMRAVITMRQARLQLHKIGKLPDVQAAIDALPNPPKTEAQIEWVYAAAVERASPFVAMLGAALGLSDADLDTLFAEASQL